jgi:hypothetical protein
MCSYHNYVYVVFSYLSSSEVVHVKLKSCFSGKQDYVTHAVMSRRHCGVKGRLGSDDDNSRHKRFAVFSK